MTTEDARARRAIVSLGSNVDSERWVPWAVARLRERFADVRVSPAYRSPASGPPGRPPFTNLVVAFRTDLPAAALRAVLRHLEALAGRRRSEDRYAPRTLDLDIIVLDGSGGTEFADPDDAAAAHVIVPWADLEPGRIPPGASRPLDDLAGPLRGALESIGFAGGEGT